MTLVEKYDAWPEEYKPTREEEIVFKIVEDLSDRNGLSNEWFRCDEGIQGEILDEWIDIIKNT